MLEDEIKEDLKKKVKMIEDYLELSISHDVNWINIVSKQNNLDPKEYIDYYLTEIKAIERIRPIEIY